MNVQEFRRQYAAGEAPRLGWGKTPALLIVDFIEGFTSPDSALAGNWDAEISATAGVIEAARRALWPIFFTTVEYEPAVEILLARKAPRVRMLEKGTRWTRVDPRLAPEPGDGIISKRQGSAFFETSLAAELRGRDVDTVLICGCVTSGCVRASAVDAAQNGFRPLVIRECVGDRSRLAHEANLIDIEQRYGDVIGLQEVLQRASP